MLLPSFHISFSVTMLCDYFFRVPEAPTLRTFTAFLIAVVLTIVLPVANEALVNAEAVLAVVASSGAEQGVCCCERKTE